MRNRLVVHAMDLAQDGTAIVGLRSGTVKRT
jgi:hypothetical protein